MTDRQTIDRKILEVRGINKSFPGVQALSNFDFDLRKCEVHCLIGENGAGKSTFIKILSGAYTPTSGEIYIEGSFYPSLSTRLVRDLGIQTVYQEDILVPQISAAENIFLGSARHRKSFRVDHRDMKSRAEDLAREYGIDLDVSSPYEDLNPSDQQFTKILKTLTQYPKVLILDEPNQVFNIRDTELVIRIVKTITQKGVSVIYIAHDLDEIIEVADRVTVLRDGVKIRTYDKAMEILDADSLAKEMVGRPVELFYKKKRHPIGDVVFEVRDLKLGPELKPIDFTLRRGEVLGVAGLKGSGRSAIARAIFGAMEKHSGTILLNGREITPKSPIDAVKNGVALLTEDKKVDGLFMGMPVYQNITIVGLGSIGKLLIKRRREKQQAKKLIHRLNIKAASPEQEVRYLSGGNQQKVVIAKWLFQGVDVLIVDEPTHGIDVNAKVEVYELFTELTSSGKSIIMISSEMPEVISISDRVLVIKDLEITKELTGVEITEENILAGYLGSS
ncbi:MAG: sugar ABC transporter ATP-binding protein [Spirochaetota bacterium]